MKQVNKAFFIFPLSVFLLICSSVQLSCSDKNGCNKSTIDSLKTALAQNQYQLYALRHDINAIVSHYSRNEYYTVLNNYGLPLVPTAQFFLWEKYGMIYPSDLFTRNTEDKNDLDHVIINNLIENLNNSIYKKNLSTEIMTEWTEIVNRDGFDIIKDFHDGFSMYADEVPTFDGVSIGDFIEKNQILFVTAMKEYQDGFENYSGDLTTLDRTSFGEFSKQNQELYLSENDSEILHIYAYIDVNRNGSCKAHIYRKNNPEADSLLVQLFENAKDVEPAKINGVSINYRYYRCFNLDKQYMLPYALHNATSKTNP